MSSTWGLKALIFDVDGTLADTERSGHLVAFNRAFADAGLDWVWSEALYGELLAVSGGKERIRHYLATCNKAFKAPGDLDGFIANLHEAKTRHFTRMLEAGQITLRPGIKRLILEARNHVRLAIATTLSGESVKTLLRATLDEDAVSWFDVIGAGENASTKKPAADIYLYVLNALSLASSACVAIEDSANGLQSSLGAGIDSIITVNDYTHAQDFTGACLVIDHLGEPDKPMSVIAGDAMGASFINLEFLEKIKKMKSE